MRRFIISILVILVFAADLSAQFKQSSNGLTATPPGAGATNQINPDSDVPADTTGGFSFKRLFRGLAHKDTLTPGYMLLSSVIMPSSIQIYNKDYWTLPIIYGGIGAGVGLGIDFNNKYRKTGDPKFATYRNISFAGAALIYWGQMLDGVASASSDRNPDPGKATVFSALLPGLGQAYNGDWWHIPIWYGGLAVCAYTFHQNDMQYKRFRYIYNTASDPESGYIGKITADQAKTYRDMYRKYRDYSVVAAVLVYVLNIIDANVFAYMKDFSVDDNLAMRVEPSIIEPITTYYGSNALPVAAGMQMSFKF